MRLVFIVLLLFSALSAYAADYTAGTKCPTAVNHKPMDNVEYQAGKNAAGYAVAPADIMPAPLSADDFRNTKLPLDIPVSDYIDNGRKNAADGEKINLNTERMELRAGEVAVDAKTGGVKFNGRDISSPEPTIIDPDCWK